MKHEIGKEKSSASDVPVINELLDKLKSNYQTSEKIEFKLNILFNRIKEALVGSEPKCEESTCDEDKTRINFLREFSNELEGSQKRILETINRIEEYI